MKKYIILTAILACLAAGCAKSPASLSTDATRRYLEAWVHVQKQKHPEYLDAFEKRMDMTSGHRFNMMMRASSMPILFGVRLIVLVKLILDIVFSHTLSGK